MVRSSAGGPQLDRRAGKRARSSFGADELAERSANLTLGAAR
jgi:hypothetical protein